MHCKRSWVDLTKVRLLEFQCCNVHTNTPLLDLVLQLCNNPIQNYLDILKLAKSKIHLFIASCCHLFAIFK